MPTVTDTPETRSKICDLARMTEEVLLLLLRDNQELKDRLDAEVRERERQVGELRERLEKEAGGLREGLDREREERRADASRLDGALDAQAAKGDREGEELRRMLAEEAAERKAEDADIREYFGRENEDRKSNLDDVNEWIKVENEKRRREAEALQARMEREKQELRDYIEKDNKAMKDKLSEEEEERKRREAAMQDALKEQEAARENEIIQLYKKMARENAKREEEIEELRARLEREREEDRQRLEREKRELKERLERENGELRDRLEKERRGLKTNIDDNLYDGNRKMADLAAKLAKLVSESGDGLKELNRRMDKDNRYLKQQMSRPLSVYFDAYRTEDYLSGGEEYLTFAGCLSNLGRGMDPASGVFTAPQAGAYLFVIHVCTHDMKKALLTLRKNGSQVASFYDQNHESNHKNSMAGQSVLLELEAQDRVQVYIFTETGLQDKRNNHLTHFVGMFLRPKDFMADVELETRLNGH